MTKSNRSFEKINDDIKSAGQTFLGFYMSDLIKRIPELDDKDLKKRLIREYYDNQRGFRDSDISGTQTRVNSAIRIIRADKVIYALSQIDGSDPRVDKGAVYYAKQTIEKIHNGEIKLPKL